MLTMTNGFKTAIKSPVRTVKARVEVYQGSTLVETYKQDDSLQSIEIQRVGNTNLFFGFGICQRLNVKLRDMSREISLSTNHRLKVYFGAGDGEVKTCSFKVSEVHRDENTNQLSITAYDALYPAANTIMPQQTLDLYSLPIMANKAIGLLDNGLQGITTENMDTTLWNEIRPQPNYEGSEYVRDILDDIAEDAQCIYYIDSNDYLCFKRLAVNAEPAWPITKSDYITLQSGDNRRLQTITHATELGDNVSASTTQIGSTQYVRDNAWWENDENVAARVEAALAFAGNMSINQFECTWRSNPAVEIGDKISLETKDGNTVYAYLLDDVLSYDGALSQKTKWQYTDSGETESNPVTLGESLKQTYAKVDKVNKQIDLVVSNTAELKEDMSQLQLNTDSISASVSSLQETVENESEALYDQISSVRNEVEMKLDSEQLNIAISTELANGVNQVTTATGYTFNADGLSIKRSDSEITTTISEDGMSIKRGYDQVLTANNEGVSAEDLHATTYLIIGETSRFEDYKDGYKKRTGCFWIGG